jgi:aldose 1-epimerase
LYTINHIQDANKQLDYIEIEDANQVSYAKININQGASLQLLSLNSTPVIKDLDPLPYSDTYASSILFPFANRIKDGTYQYKGETYKFEINQVEEKNALHGLVYNKTFKILNKNTTDDEASVILEYKELNVSKGFPYTYAIQLKYVFTKDSLNLSVSVKNTDAKPFPFTLGWHPYFYSSDLHSSTLIFNSTKKLILGDRNITTGVEDIDVVDVFEVKGKQLDDCYILDSNKIVFKTPDYDMEMTASSEDNYLQMYIPPKANTIAIEPTTGVSDSFNNGMGLQELQPNDIYNLEWAIKIITN